METRRAKRRRKALEYDIEDGDEAPESNSIHVAPSFLTRVPSDVHVHIMRHLSTRPNHPRWASYVSPSDVLTLVQSRPLRNIARKYIFTILHSHFEYMQPRNRIAYGVQLERAVDTSMFNDLLSELSRYLTVLTFDINYDNYHTTGSMFEYCTNLKTLYVGYRHNGFNLNYVLKACGNVLEEIHLGKVAVLMETHIEALKLYAKNLRTISLEHENAEVSLVAMWKAIGAKLEKISFAPPSILGYGGKMATREQLSTIVQHCKKLSEVEILQGRKHLPAMPLLVQLGARLKVLKFMAHDSCPTPSQLKRIVDECPQVKLHLFLGKKTTVREILGTEDIASKIAVLKIRSLPTHMDDTIFNHLTHLTQVNFLFRHNVREIDIMQKNFFAVPKPALVKIQTTRLANLLKVLNKHPYNHIEDLEVSANQPIVPELFAAFLARNYMGRLRRLWINYKIPRGSYRPNMHNTEVLTAQLLRNIIEWKKRGNNNKGKMEVVVKDPHRKNISTAIRDACVGARSINIDVIIGDVQYVPKATKLTRKYIQY